MYTGGTDTNTHTHTHTHTYTHTHTPVAHHLLLAAPATQMHPPCCQRQLQIAQHQQSQPALYHNQNYNMVYISKSCAHESPYNSVFVYIRYTFETFVFKVITAPHMTQHVNIIETLCVQAIWDSRMDQHNIVYILTLHIIKSY